MTVVADRPRVLRGIIEPLAVFAVTRLGLLGVSAAGRLLLAPADEAARGVLYGWTNWDAWWYVTIAVNGYTFDPTHQSNVAFFPLYPLLIRAFLIVNVNPLVAGVLISNVSLAVALVLVYWIARDHFGADVARRSIFLLACFPFAYFFSAVYTEATFLALAALSFWLAEREKWWLAGLAGGLCSATRLVGLTLMPALLLLYAERRCYRIANAKLDLAAIGIVPLGFLSFVAFSYARFGDPFVMLQSADGWGVYNPLRQGFGRLDPAMFVPSNFDFVFALNLIAAIAWLIATIPVARALGPGYAAYVFLGTLIPLVDKVDSLGRYVAVLFPVFIVVARSIKSRIVFDLAIASSVLLLSVLTVLFTNGFRVF